MTCFDRLYEKPVCVESLSVSYDRDCAPVFCITWIRMWNVMQCERFYSWMLYQNVLVNTWCIQKVFSYRWWLPGMITIIATCFFSLSSWLDNWIMPVQSHLWWSWISYGLFNDSIFMISRQENVVTVFPEIEVVFSRCVSFTDWNRWIRILWGLNRKNQSTSTCVLSMTYCISGSGQVEPCQVPVYCYPAELCCE